MFVCRFFGVVGFLFGVRVATAAHDSVAGGVPGVILGIRVHVLRVVVRWRQGRNRAQPVLAARKHLQPTLEQQADDFLRAVETDGDWNLIGRTNKKITKTLKARDLWEKIGHAAWASADPGIQFHTTINDWHTNPETGRITASNPCSEYMSLDNSSCNLASLNLLKFLKDDDTFDAAKFQKSVEFIITAMDISICFADFPTEKIGETTRAFRQLGIGYANLGALLMAIGVPYDSKEGFAIAAAITSLMTGASYRRSAELAGVVGAYDGYAKNKAGHDRIMAKHEAANAELRPVNSIDAQILEAATEQWALNTLIGAENGWRNAQASLLAPTGTIGFMMDCDTTGIEPDFSLVKYKKLSTGGSMQIVNQTIPFALHRLGYSQETIEAIVDYIGEHGHVVDAPGLKAEHYAQALQVQAPGLWLNRRIARRQRELFEAFPDAIDLVIVCMEAGLGLDAALERTAQDMALRSAALAPVSIPSEVACSGDRSSICAASASRNAGAPCADAGSGAGGRTAAATGLRVQASSASAALPAPSRTSDWRRDRVRFFMPAWIGSREGVSNPVRHVTSQSWILCFRSSSLPPSP